jgi:hypothetical protein
MKPIVQPTQQTPPPREKTTVIALTSREYGLLIHLLNERIIEAQKAGIGMEESSSLFRIQLLQKLRMGRHLLVNIPLGEEET